MEKLRMATFSNQILGNIAAFADLETRITINRFIDEPVYRCSRKIENPNEFNKDVVMKEMFACLRRIEDEPVHSMNDVIVKTLIRFFNLVCSEEGIKLMKRHGGMAKNVNNKAWEAGHCKSYQWYHASKKPERITLKACARRALTISCNIIIYGHA